MYLVHKCSMAFFEWGSLNSDQFATLIADCEKIKAVRLFQIDIGNNSEIGNNLIRYIFH